MDTLQNLLIRIENNPYNGVSELNPLFSHHPNEHYSVIRQVVTHNYNNDLTPNIFFHNAFLLFVSTNERISKFYVGEFFLNIEEEFTYENLKSLIQDGFVFDVVSDVHHFLKMNDINNSNFNKIMKEILEEGINGKYPFQQQQRLISILGTIKQLKKQL